MFHVEYVFKVYDENDPVLRKIVEYCSLIHIKLVIREYNPTWIDEDLDDITRLPAMHFYENNIYQDTHYPDKNPISAIRTSYDKYVLAYFERLAKKQIWDEKIRYLKSIFKRNISKTDCDQKGDRIS